jgi:hypothetical protein
MAANRPGLEPGTKRRVSGPLSPCCRSEASERRPGGRTIRRWIAEDAEFQGELATARRASFQAGVERVQALMGQAVGVLEELLADKKHPAVRLGAARMVIELALNRNDAEALLARVEELERVHRET